MLARWIEEPEHVSLLFFARPTYTPLLETLFRYHVATTQAQRCKSIPLTSGMSSTSTRLVRVS